MRLMAQEAKTPRKAVDLGGVGLSEGESAKRLLEANGYDARSQKTKNGQWEFNCPFHEEPGPIGKGKATNFYLTEKTSQYYCHSASCGEQGNLQTLERFFGVESDPALFSKFKSKDTELKEFQANLKSEHYQFLHREKGLNERTVDRFRIGYDKFRDAYVIPYLESRRPVAFRFYDPVKRGEDAKGNPTYGGPNGSKYWWEAAKDSIGEQNDENVLRLFQPGAANGDPEAREVFICEGEFKAMLLSQWGYSAVGIPGASGFKQEWARFFMHARKVFICMDNDNPDFHRHGPCHKCETVDKKDCNGHNPGQEATAKLLDFFGYRGHNVLLPLPDDERKTDINEYAMRDGHTKYEFAKLLTGENETSPYTALSLTQIRKNPPPEAVFLVGGGLLPRGGRLLVTGAPKVGKSIFIENMVLSIAAGIPFLHRFEMANTGLTPGHRVLLLDRELSDRSLFDRLNQLIEERPGYAAAEDKLLIDHKFKLHLDLPGAAEDLIGLIRENNAEVVVLDTGYKFFANGDMEGSRSLAKAFASIDAAILETGCSFILTHHHRKGSNAKGEAPSADSVVGSFLWTGWANGTVLLNFKNRSVSDPFTTTATFAAFRDAAAPEPLLLKRDRESICYTDIEDYSFDEEVEEQKVRTGYSAARPRLNYESLSDLLMTQVPALEDEFLHAAAAHFGMKVENVKITLMDILDRSSDFERTGKGTRVSPTVLTYTGDNRGEESYDAEQARLAGHFAFDQSSIEEMLP